MSSQADTCWTVLRDAAAGDMNARAIFSTCYEGVVREYLRLRWRRVSLRSEIDDATQEVFVECLKPGGVLERADASKGEFRRLLFAVVRNVARRFEQRRAAGHHDTPEISAELRQLASDDAGQATLFDRSWAHAMLRDAKARHVEVALADREGGHRRIELLERRFGSDEAIRDIAASWGVDVRQVHNAYRKARTEFYGCLREVVAFHAPPGADLDAECRRVLAALR